MTPKTIAIALLYSFAVLFSSHLQADEVIIDDLEKISHKVVYVNAFGQWRNGDQNGHYRVILLDAEEEYPHSKIFLQWVLEVEDDEDQILGSAPIIEINNVGVFKLSVPKISSNKDGNAIELTAVNQYSQSVQNLEIWPREVNHYDLNYTSQAYPPSVNSAVGDIPLSLDYYARPTF